MVTSRGRTSAGLLLSVAMMLLAGCRKSEPSDPRALDAQGCILEPAPPPDGERGPFPLESCRVLLRDARPPMVLEQEITARRRGAAPKACCYVALAPR